MEYTEESLNEYYHAVVNGPHDPAIASHESGHLRYEKNRGVVRVQVADCSLCVEQGLDDGQRHEVAA